MRRANLGQDIGCSLVCCRCPNAARTRTECHVVTHIEMTDQRVLLEHHRDPPVLRRNEHPRTWVIPHAIGPNETAVIEWLKAGEATQHRGLASAIRADNGHGGAACNVDQRIDATVANAHDDAAVHTHRRPPMAPVHRSRMDTSTTNDTIINNTLISSA